MAFIMFIYRALHYFSVSAHLSYAHLDVVCLCPHRFLFCILCPSLFLFLLSEDHAQILCYLTLIFISGWFRRQLYYYCLLHQQFICTFFVGNGGHRHQ
ncbi:hypothetical protein CYLTODRAFT_284238 [Cylindrobasidium torrendii FP15055 ss-10]|uniref:Uncharacterized protein n=1 Tax=Cylindrobasidium torrendii FP15055 ss-10 TaxID=1314674 RepID=A0A0D7BR69_9AGAR|nr:hypothetical protein CYLTODRAFT_284238 [Cylindrobasidium torrendii FP15055 ss-10]